MRAKMNEAKTKYREISSYVRNSQYSHVNIQIFVNAEKFSYLGTKINRVYPTTNEIRDAF